MGLLNFNAAPVFWVVWGRLGSNSASPNAHSPQVALRAVVLVDLDDFPAHSLGYRLISQIDR
jgi:hypothetical protein